MEPGHPVRSEFYRGRRKLSPAAPEQRSKGFGALLQSLWSNTPGLLEKPSQAVPENAQPQRMM
jgi:hypothetical protein